MEDATAKLNRDLIVAVPRVDIGRGGPPLKSPSLRNQAAKRRPMPFSIRPHRTKRPRKNLDRVRQKDLQDLRQP